MHWLTSRSILAGSQQASKEVRTRGTRADKKVLASIDANGVEMINVHRLAGVHASRTKYTIILAFVWPEPAGKHRCKRDDADVLTNHWAGQLAHEFPCKPQPCEGHRENKKKASGVPMYNRAGKGDLVSTGTGKLCRTEIHPLLCLAAGRMPL